VLDFEQACANAGNPGRLTVPEPEDQTRLGPKR